MPADRSRAAVLGSPIAHSLSPVLHRAAYAQLGLDWHYDAIEVTEDALPGFVAGLGPEWAGLSLTMPLKRAILPMLDTTSDTVRLVGAANTVVLDEGGRHGHNTDVIGIVAALEEAGARPGPAVILGGGATAASALAALASMGCSQVVVHTRRPEAVRGLADLADSLGVSLAGAPWPAPGARLPDRGEARIVVCTVPGTASSALTDAVPVEPGVLLDVSYDPWPPALVTQWRTAGGGAVAGDAMLLHQAAAQVELMTGLRPDVAVMRAVLDARISERTPSG